MGQSPFYSWENPLFRLGHGFNSDVTNYQRVKKKILKIDHMGLIAGIYIYMCVCVCLMVIDCFFYWHLLTDK